MVLRHGILLGLIIALAFTTGAAAATTAMKVTVNGVPVLFRTAPRFAKQVLMVPLEELVAALGIEAKWNVGTNTLEIVSPGKGAICTAEGTLPVPALSWPEVAARLASEYGAYGSGERQMHVTWSLDPYSSEAAPLVLAAMNEADYAAFTALKGPEMLAWFKEASSLVAKAYPSSARVVLVWNSVYHDYPYDRPHDDIALTDDYQWSATDCEIWSEISDGVVRTFWDEQKK